MNGKINAALENPTPQNIAALLDDEDLVFYVDWREEDEDMVWSCAHLLQDFALEPEYKGEDLFIRCGKKRVRVPLTGTPADRHITLLALNEALSPHDEIRFCLDSNGADTLAFLVLSRIAWRELEAKYGAEVAKRFSVIAEKPNLFTDVF